MTPSPPARTTSDAPSQPHASAFYQPTLTCFLSSFFFLSCLAFFPLFFSPHVFHLNTGASPRKPNPSVPTILQSTRTPLCSWGWEGVCTISESSWTTCYECSTAREEKSLLALERLQTYPSCFTPARYPRFLRTRSSINTWQIPCSPSSSRTVQKVLWRPFHLLFSVITVLTDPVTCPFLPRNIEL